MTNMILFYRICEIKKFIGTDKNRNNFYGVRRCHVNNSIDYNYWQGFYSNICSNDWFTTFTFWFQIILGGNKHKNLET